MSQIFFAIFSTHGLQIDTGRRHRSSGTSHSSPWRDASRDPFSITKADLSSPDFPVKACLSLNPAAFAAEEKAGVVVDFSLHHVTSSEKFIAPPSPVPVRIACILPQTYILQSSYLCITSNFVLFISPLSVSEDPPSRLFGFLRGWKSPRSAFQDPRFGISAQAPLQPLPG